MNATVVKTQSQTNGKGGFGEAEFLANARLYAIHKPMIDALSRVKAKDGESRADAIQRTVTEALGAWESLEKQSANGAGFTPANGLGFGNSNAAMIADQILGKAASTAQTRTLLKNAGKGQS